MKQVDSRPMQVSRRQLLLGGGVLAGSLALGASLAGCGGAAQAAGNDLRFWHLLSGGDGIKMQAMIDQRERSPSGIHREAHGAGLGSAVLHQAGHGDRRRPSARRRDHARRHGSPGYAPGGLLDAWDLDLLAEYGVTSPRLHRAHLGEEPAGRQAVFSIALDSHPFIMMYNTDVAGKAGVLGADGQLAGSSVPDAVPRGGPGHAGRDREARTLLRLPRRRRPDVAAVLHALQAARRRHGPDPGQPARGRPGRRDRVARIHPASLLDDTICHPERRLRHRGIAEFCPGQSSGMLFTGVWELPTMQERRHPVRRDNHSHPLRHARPPTPTRTRSSCRTRRSPTTRSGGTSTSSSATSCSRARSTGPRPGTSRRSSRSCESQEYQALLPQAHYAHAADILNYDPEAWFTGSGSRLPELLRRDRPERLPGRRPTPPRAGTPSSRRDQRPARQAEPGLTRPRVDKGVHMHAPLQRRAGASAARPAPPHRAIQSRTVPPRAQAARQPASAGRFVAPFLIVFAMFLVWPMIHGFYLSLTGEITHRRQRQPSSASPTTPRRFADPIMWRSLRNTALVHGAVAPSRWWSSPWSWRLLVNQGLPGQWLWRLSFFMPFLLASTVVSLFLDLDVQPAAGARATTSWRSSGLPPVAWLQDPDRGHVGDRHRHRRGGRSASTSCCTWPRCRTSRSSSTRRHRSTAPAGWRQFFSITLPQLGPTTVLIVILQILASLKVFDQIYQMTGGGPGGVNPPGRAVHLRDRLHRLPVRVLGRHLLHLLRPDRASSRSRRSVITPAGAHSHDHHRHSSPRRAPSPGRRGRFAGRTCRPARKIRQPGPHRGPPSRSSSSPSRGCCRSLWAVVTAFKTETDAAATPVSLAAGVAASPLDAFAKRAAAGQHPALDLEQPLTSTAITVITLRDLARSPPTRFSRIDFRGKQVAVLAVIIASIIIPPPVLIIPLFYEMLTLNLSTPTGRIILPQVVHPAMVFILKKFFDQIPDRARGRGTRSTVPAGCGSSGPIVLPLSRPILAAVAIFVFIGAWNNFLWPFIATNDTSLHDPARSGCRPSRAPTACSTRRSWRPPCSRRCPLIVVFLFFQRQIIKGVATTGFGGQ